MKQKLQKYIGKKATITINGLIIDVEIIDVKNSYGNDRFLIKPVAGVGEVWVEKLAIKK